MTKFGKLLVTDRSRPFLEGGSWPDLVNVLPGDLKGCNNFHSHVISSPSEEVLPDGSAKIWEHFQPKTFQALSETVPNFLGGRNLKMFHGKTSKSPWGFWKKNRFSRMSMSRGAPPQFISYHTIEVRGTGSDDLGLIQSTKAPKHQSTAFREWSMTYHQQWPAA